MLTAVVLLSAYVGTLVVGASFRYGRLYDRLYGSRLGR